MLLLDIDLMRQLVPGRSDVETVVVAILYSLDRDQ